jgi:hypothetical protein
LTAHVELLKSTYHGNYCCSLVARRGSADERTAQRSARRSNQAHFAEFGGPWFLTAWEGGMLLGVFHPESLGPKQTTMPDFPPEFIEEIKRRNKEIVSGRAKLLTSEEALAFMMKELDRMDAEEVQKKHVT